MFRSLIPRNYLGRTGTEWHVHPYFIETPYQSPAPSFSATEFISHVPDIRDGESIGGRKRPITPFEDITLFIKHTDLSVKMQATREISSVFRCR